MIIAGGGLGGLALAAGLRKRHIPVTVMEKDADLAATGGYHIHLDRAATLALRDLLQPQDFERFLASAATARAQGGDVMRDMHGRLLYRSHDAHGDGGVNIDRITLRLLLAAATGSSLHTGATVERFDKTGEGIVTVTLTDATTHECDLLIGADGVHSVVAQELAGGPTNHPTGLLGIGGATRLSVLSTKAQNRFSQESGLAIGPSGTGLYIGYHDPVRRAAADSPELADPATTEPTYIWGAVLSESDDTDALRPLHGAALRDATCDLLHAAGWRDPMLEVVSRTSLDHLAAFRFHAGPTEARLLAPWPAGHVTALGDAVHAMPPTAGMGAATALIDAAHLADALTAVVDGTATIPTAMYEFEHDMRQRGAQAIRASLKPVAFIQATASPVGRIGARVGLPLCAALARLQPNKS